MGNDSDYLMISGLKHFRFCRRRWALVHLEQLWQDNALTMDGNYMHDRVHDESFTELRGSVLLSRGMPVKSECLRISGVCDMVELRRNENGVSIRGRDGKWTIYPVEYKLGKPDERGADEMQLCAQALCLEEMFVTTIYEGAIYYGKTHHRKQIIIDRELREQTVKALTEMHQMFSKGYTPRAKPTKACKSCSLVELCQPYLTKKLSASEYVARALEE